MPKKKKRLTNELEEWYLYRSALCIATHHYYLFGRTNSLNLYIYLNHHSSSWFLNRWFFVIWIRIKHTLPATICVSYTRLVLPRIYTILNSILIFRDSILTCNRLMTFFFLVKILWHFCLLYFWRTNIWHMIVSGFKHTGR